LPKKPRFKEIVVVLHVFKKKSKHGIATPKQEIDLVKARLKYAEQLYPEWLEEINRGK
jgi:phage-related protein